MRKQIEGPNQGGTFGEDDLLKIPDFLDRRPNSANSQNSAPPEEPEKHAAPDPDVNSTGEGPPPRPPQMEAARAYARRGWRVLPLHTGKDGTCTCGRAGCDSPAKHPRTAHGAKDATTDETQIRAWWTTRPNGNIGIATGTESGIVVVDLDPRNGGDKSLADFEAKHGSLPLTPKVRTGGGGAHFYFRPPGGKMACRANLIPGIDFRGEGGYVVAPPSEHVSGEAYEWEVSPDDAPLADLPPALLELIRPSAQDDGAQAHAPKEPVSLDDLNIPDWIKQLIREGPAEGQYKSRSEAVFAAIRSLVKAGYDDVTIRAVLLDPANKLGEKPREKGAAWLHAEIARARTKDDVPGLNTKSGGALRAVTAQALLTLELPPRELVLDPWLPTQGLGLVHAIRGVGKTQMALGIAYAVASGTSLLRWHAPKPRRVLYVDGELPATVMQERLAAIMKGVTGQPPDPEYLRLITPDLQEGPIPNVSTPNGQAALEPFLDGLELLVLDSLSTLCRSGKENEAESWLPVQEYALKLRRRGISVIFIHHSGKGGQQRGTSRREDVLDTVIKLQRPSDYQPSQGARFEVHFEKARSLHGEAVSPFEVLLEVRDGAAQWSVQDLEDTLSRRVADLLNEGLTQREIAHKLGIGLGTVNRHAKKAHDKGMVNEAE